MREHNYYTEGLSIRKLYDTLDREFPNRDVSVAELQEYLNNMYTTLLVTSSNQEQRVSKNYVREWIGDKKIREVLSYYFKRERPPLEEIEDFDLSFN